MIWIQPWTWYHMYPASRAERNKPFGMNKAEWIQRTSDGCEEVDLSANIGGEAAFSREIIRIIWSAWLKIIRKYKHAIQQATFYLPGRQSALYDQLAGMIRVHILDAVNRSECICYRRSKGFSRSFWNDIMAPDELKRDLDQWKVYRMRQISSNLVVVRVRRQRWKQKQEIMYENSRIYL